MIFDYRPMGPLELERISYKEVFSFYRKCKRPIRGCIIFLPKVPINVEKLGKIKTIIE